FGKAYRARHWSRTASPHERDRYVVKLDVCVSRRLPGLNARVACVPSQISHRASVDGHSPCARAGNHRPINMRIINVDGIRHGDVAHCDAIGFALGRLVLPIRAVVRVRGIETIERTATTETDFAFA